MSDYRVEQILRKKIVWPMQERKHFGKEELAELAATIRVHGILEPIGVVRDGDGYVGLWGQRRDLAAELIGLDSIPAFVRDKPRSIAEGMEIRLIENIQRESLRPIEQAFGLDQLMKAGSLTASEVARRIGMKPAAATKSLSLLHLPQAIRDKIDAGLISAGAGYELARVENPQLQAEFAEQVAAGALTRDALAREIKSAQRPATRSKKPKKSRVIAKLSGGRMVTVCGSNLTVDTVITTLEDVLTRCRAARNKGLGLGTILKVLADEARQLP